MLNSPQQQKQPRVSVVIPCYNSARFLGESVKSIVEQTVPVEEIIIVDDASTDNSFEYAQALAAQCENTRIIVRRNIENMGPGRSRNIGIDAAGGDYVAFLDADDIWLPDKLEKQLNFLSAGDFAAVISEVVITDEKLIPFARLDKSGYQDLSSHDLARAAYLGEIAMSTPTLVGERQVLLNHGGFDETLRLREDHALLIRLSVSGKLGVLAEPVVKRRAHTGSYSSGISPLYKYRQEVRFIQIFRKDFDLQTVTHARERAYRTMIAHCFLIGEKRWALRFLQQLRKFTGQPATKFLPYYALALLPGATTGSLMKLQRNIRRITRRKGLAAYA